MLSVSVMGHSVSGGAVYFIDAYGELILTELIYITFLVEHATVHPCR